MADEATANVQMPTHAPRRFTRLVGTAAYNSALKTRHQPTVKLTTSCDTGCSMKSAVAVQALVAAHRPRSARGRRPAASRAASVQPAARVSWQGSRLVEAGRNVAHNT